MNKIFSWQQSELEMLVKSCESDDVSALIEKYIPKSYYILESGCGSGRYVRYLKDHGWKVTGLELGIETVAMIKKVWPDLDIVQGNADTHPFNDNKFEAIISLGVVEHDPEGPHKIIEDLFRVLKPGGIAIITVPCLNIVRRIKHLIWWNEIIRTPRRSAKWVLKRQKLLFNRRNRDYKYVVSPSIEQFSEYHMTPDQFVKEIKNVGFKIIKHQPIGEIDGFYHELNPFGLFVQFRNWEFSYSPFVKSINKLLSYWPFFHCHIQGVVAQKP